MKKFAVLLLAGSAISFASSASAADYMGAPGALPFDWTGFYVGLQAGGGFTRLTAAGALNMDGLMLGAHAGFNFQSGAFVFGGEADINYNWNRAINAGTTFQTPWDGSIRARLGYAIDRTLIYATGGVALTSLRIDPAGAPAPFNTGYTGWTVGAGVEHAFTNNWTARIEYRYTDFGTRNIAPAGPVRLRKNQVLVGASYKF